jgi:hypothetical protein
MIIGRSHKTWSRWIVGIALASAFCSAHSATYTVTNSNDSGAGSFRQALISANATTANDTIVFSTATNGTPIVLQSALPQIASTGGDLTITGNGPANAWT